MPLLKETITEEDKVVLRAHLYFPNQRPQRSQRAQEKEMSHFGKLCGHPLSSSNFGSSGSSNKQCSDVIE